METTLETAPKKLRGEQCHLLASFPFSKAILTASISCARGDSNPHTVKY
jgi:hypothetical protein